MDNKGYGDDYYQSHCGVEDYYHNPQMIAFFKGVAQEIKTRFSPRTVLDVGCACGHLVKALRELGVEAWGVDASVAALKAAHPSIAGYLGRMTLPAKELPGAFPKSYDLVVNIEVLEHISEASAADSVGALCSYGDVVLFSSTPWDYNEPTHTNLHQPSYWCRLFRGQGYAYDPRSHVDWLTPQAMVFRRMAETDCESIPQEYFDLVDAHAEATRILLDRRDEEIRLSVERRKLVQEQQKALDAKDARIQDLQKALDAKDVRIQEVQKEVRALTERGLSHEQQHGAKAEELTKLVVRLSETCKREVESLEGKNAALAGELDSLQRFNEFQRKTLQEQSVKILEQEQVMRKKDEALVASQCAQDELRKILASRSYRLALKFRKLARIIRRGR